MKKKNLTILACFLLIAIMFIPVSVYAFAAESCVDLVSEIPYESGILEDTINENKKLKEKGTDLYQEKTIALIAEDLANNNTDIENELNKQIEQYEKMLENEMSDEYEKINSLISTTRLLKSSLLISPEYRVYDNYINANFFQSSDAVVNIIYSASIDLSFWVSTAIAYFSLSGYNLSAELITHAYNNQVVGSYYTPVYASRVLASQVTYDVASANLISGAHAFPNSGSTYEKDLYYSIHKFKYNKTTSNSKIINLEDTYDFESHNSDYSDIENYAVDRVYEAMQAGIIKSFELRITIDASEFPRTTVVSKTDSTWKIKVWNYNSGAMDIVYNTKMCFEGDAKNWNNLKHLKTIRVAGNGSQIVDVQENLLAGSIVFCYNIGNIRKITSSFELDANGTLNQNVTTISYNYYYNIGIVGKNGSTWIINVINTYGSNRIFEYNTKMCFGWDAQNWTDLRHLVSFTLAASESRTVEITENGTAGYIATSFISETERNIRYANQLSENNNNSSMTVSDGIIYIFNYLSLSNSGKSSGTWTIKISNPLSVGITVYYNEKMCFEGDAKNWTSLIATNGVAGHITTSYFSNGKRVISYANGLSNSGGISVKYNYI